MRKTSLRMYQSICAKYCWNFLNYIFRVTVRLLKNWLHIFMSVDRTHSRGSITESSVTTLNQCIVTSSQRREDNEDCGIHSDSFISSRWIYISKEDEMLAWKSNNNNAKNNNTEGIKPIKLRVPISNFHWSDLDLNLTDSSYRHLL